MMDRIIVALSGRYPDLAELEARTVLGMRGRRFPGILVGEANEPERSGVLSLTRTIGALVCKCRLDARLPPRTATWPKMAGTFKVVGSTEQVNALLASWCRKANPHLRPDLHQATSVVDSVVSGSYRYVFVRRWTDEQPFEDRKAHRWPMPHPTACDPRLARALVNCADARSILDPFCGAGGILIEAGLAGVRAMGCDIDEDMVRRARVNLSHFGVHASLDVDDATTLNRFKKDDVDAIVTDLPYGRNSRLQAADSTYELFLRRARRLVSRAVVVFPSCAFRPALLRRTGWKSTHAFDVYVHKSLSKKVVVLTA
ncbi:MAG: methyltransferase domain-containing protein [Nanoarchaeota archaeon]